MKVAIFIRSFYKDAQWLRYCLRSLRKYAVGFEYVLVTVPSRDKSVFEPMQQEFKFRLDLYDVREDKPMINGELRVCRADELCPDVEHILFVDSDCTATQMFAPLDYFVSGKPVMIGRAFERLKYSANETERAMERYWRPATRNALGWDPSHETNMRVPCIFKHGTFKPFREAVERHVGRSLEDYAYSCHDHPFPQTFIEFTPLGNFVLRQQCDQYYFADLDGPGVNVNADSGAPLLVKKFRQDWSHGGFTDRIRADLEAICA